MSFYSHVTFDLDDTLLDTSGGLIPAAARRAVSIIASTNPGLGDIETLLRRRTDVLRSEPRADIWLKLAAGDAALAEQARGLFFRHPIESVPSESIRLTLGALELLDWTHARAVLHLVTSGDAETQKHKIERLGIGHYFETIQYVESRPTPPNGRGSKHSAFLTTRDRYPKVTPRGFLSIGNRVDTDLGEAKLLDWRTVWIRYGEHALLSPAKPSEIPDFEVASPAELLSIWRQQFDSVPLRIAK